MGARGRRSNGHPALWGQFCWMDRLVTPSATRPPWGRPSGDAPRNGGHDIREAQSAERDEDHGQRGYRGIGNGRDSLGEQCPEPSPEGDADRYAYREPDGDRHRGLPSYRGPELATCEPERLQEGELPTAAPDRRDQCEPEGPSAPAARTEASRVGVDPTAP